MEKNDLDLNKRYILNDVKYKLLQHLINYYHNLLPNLINNNKMKYEEEEKRKEKNP